MAKSTKAADAAPNYRLVELRVEGFKKVKAVSIKPDRSLFTISGRNEQGKSSILDAFMAAVGGKSYMPPEPINDEMAEASIFIDATDLKISRRIWRKKDGEGFNHEVVVEYADGKQPKYAQNALDELRGSSLAGDPLEFSRMKPKEQFDLLKSLVPNFDFDKQARERKRLFDERTQVGRDFERAKGAVDSIDIPLDTRTTLIDVTELAAELRASAEFNASIDDRQRRRDAAKDKIDQLRDEIDVLTAQVNAKLIEADDLQKKLDSAEPLPAKKDASAIEQQMMDAEGINVLVRKAADKAARIRERDEYGDHYDQMTKAIEAIDAAKAAAIAKAKLPVKELTFGDEEILLDGKPFEQASSARRIRVATALLMALKPDLKVLLVREGSLLDEDSRKALDEDAAKHGFIVLMECVGDGDGRGVIIEDGVVVS